VDLLQKENICTGNSVYETISNHQRVYDRKSKLNSSQTRRYALVNTKEQQQSAPTLVDDQVVTDQPSVMVEPPKIDGDGITSSIDQSDKYITPLKTVK